MLFKCLLLSLSLCALALPAMGDQSTCDVSRRNLLAEDLLEALTLKVCPRDNSARQDIHLEYEEQQKVKTASDFLVYQYTAECYKKINTELYKTTDQNMETLKIAEQLDAVLCDYPKSKTQVFRGANLPEAVVKKYLASDEISFPAFLSTSTSLSIACEFATKGNTLLKMVSKSGRIIGNHSRHSLEEEILFRTNTRFKVIKAISGSEASVISGCKGVSNYFELEEIYTEE